ncbi:MAG TPA: type I glyceraldehyde-3-phosphate dehydrogenase [Candidatus Polarisedimenticolia bacterium]|nr:type I glyceraldehyde-3-phosphate dehydrogenase [Candidatus Polarisedimenticolia bacterium]
MAIRIGINGLGRIGRGFLRLALEHKDLMVVAINDLADPPMLAHLLRHDSLFGRLDREVRVEGDRLRAGERAIRCTRLPRPSEIPWSDAGVDLVLEATGAFTSRAEAALHLAGGVRRVVITSPSADADLTVCYGVNHHEYAPERHRVLSNASCTTNAMAVILAVVEETFGIEQAAMTTVHCYTNGQVLMDAPHRDRRRARAAGLSMIPTSTSAAAAIVQVLPALRGRVQALAVRVPTAAVSLVDLSLILRRPATLEAARDALRTAARTRLAGILGWCEEDLVSIDFLGDGHSAVVDAPLLALQGDRLLKVFAWYDNERGYVQRLADLVRHLARREAGDGAGGPGGEG